GVHLACCITLVLLKIEVRDSPAAVTGIKCGGVLSAPSGNFSSPNFPGPYPYETECTWLIVVAEGSSVLLSFSHFELEYHAACAYDYLQVYNGAARDRGNLLGTFCGHSTPPPFASAWHVMAVVFRSDRHVAKRGFAAAYRKGNACGGQLTGLSGEITSPRYPESYPNDAECRWSIGMEGGQGCGFDYVALFDGPTASAPRLGRYCGSARPPRTVSSTQHLLVLFKSDFNIVGRGFKAHFYSGVGVPPVFPCRTLPMVLTTWVAAIPQNSWVDIGQTQGRGAVMWRVEQASAIKQVLSSQEASAFLSFPPSRRVPGSLHLPSRGTSPALSTPTSTPTTSSASGASSCPQGYRIKIFFLDLELEARSSLTGGCDYDRLSAFDGGAENASLLGTWCGHDSPVPVTSRGHQAAAGAPHGPQHGQEGLSPSPMLEGKVSAPPGGVQEPGGF
uniref:CUB domain containing protein 2 n=1 Tax=Anas platyrhynchos TaxID=8839 RepID=A0A8B9TNN9_ANAPL